MPTAVSHSVRSVSRLECFSPAILRGAVGLEELSEHDLHGRIRRGVHWDGLVRARRVDSARAVHAFDEVNVDADGAFRHPLLAAAALPAYGAHVNWIVKVLLDDKTLQSLDPRTTRASTHREIALVRKGED